MQSIGVTVRLKRRWSTAGDKPARELDRSTWEQSERRWRQLGAKFPGTTRHVEPESGPASEVPADERAGNR
jgi:hypothetical protein